MLSNSLEAKPRIITTRWEKLKPHLFALSLYTLLTLILAWPLVINLTSDMLRLYPLDREQNLWNFWWVKRSLLDTRTNPFQTTFLFYPYGTPLYLHTLSIFNTLLGIPLQLILGRVGAFNLICLLTFPAGGYGAYLLARYMLGEDAPYREWGALLAGLVFSFGPYHYAQLIKYQLNLLSLQWIPFFILFMLKLDKATSRREIIKNGLLTALFFLLVLAVDYYYTLYIVIFAGLYWLWRGSTSLWEGRKLAETRRVALRGWGILTAKLAGAFISGALPFSPILFMTIREVGSGRYVPLANDTAEQVHSADLLQLFLPPDTQPWWGENSGLWNSLGIPQLNDGGAVLGYVALLLSLYGLFRVRGLWFWGLSALFWVFISLGPSLRFNNNNIDILMPYRLFSKLPIASIGRSPDHFILMAQLCFGILGAFGLSKLLQTKNLKTQGLKFAAGGLIMTLFFLESWPGILNQTEKINQPPFTVAITADNASANVPADKALLELPVTRHGGLDTERMLYQTYHQRPINGGYTSRKLLDPHRYVNDYLLYDFIDLRSTVADIVPDKTPQDMLGLLTFANIGYVSLYPADFATSDSSLKRAQSLLNQTFGENSAPFYRDSLTTIHRVTPTPLNRPIVVLTQGWAEVETVDKNKGVYQRWIDAEVDDARANIVVGSGLPLDKNYALEIQMVSADKPRRLQVFLNGQQLADIKVNQGVTPLRFDILKLRQGDNILILKPDPADGYFVPASLTGGKGDRRQLRLGAISIKLV